MKVILRQTINKLGKAGDLVEVADGYARNYLLPRGLAVEASEGNLKQWQQQQKAAARQAEKAHEEAAALAARLENQTVVLRAKAGEGGRLFGSITAADIAAAVAELAGTAVDRRKVQLDEPLRRLGDHAVTIRLHPEVATTVTVRIEADA